jgi:multidrug resistance efflux pump
MSYQCEFDLSDCTEYRQTLLARPPRLVGATFVLLVALVAAGVLWAACTKADLVVRAAGRVRPMISSAHTPDAAAEESEVSPLRGGRVVEVHVREGDRVRGGDLLVRLETEQLENEVAQQRQLAQATAKELVMLDQTEATVHARYEAARARAQAELGEAEAAIETAKQRRDAAIRLAEISVSLAEDELRRVRRLAEGRAVTEAELVLAEGRAREARLKLQEAQLPVDEGRLNVLRHALQLVDKDLAVEESELDAKRELKESEAEAAELELTRLEWELRQCELRAPGDGAVISLDVKVGDVVEAGQVVLAVAKQRGFRLDIAVPSQDVGQLREGLPVRIKLDAYDYQKYGSLTGRVAFVSPDSAPSAAAGGDHSPAFTVRVALDGDYVGRGQHRGQIKLGMTGVVEIVTDRESILSLLFRSIRQSIRLG